MTASTGATRLIVNADDFGYFDEVSRGILDLAEAGLVTATGVMANGPALKKWSERLRAVPSFSVGVHLNATLGRPFTPEMKQALAASRGVFPTKGALLSSLLLGKLSVHTLVKEWRAQIEHCLQLQLKPEFLNSHEHVHMLPNVYPRVLKLAEQYGIAHVRAPQPEWAPGPDLAGTVRSAAFLVLRTVLARPRPHTPHLIGLLPSGHLDAAFLQWRLPKLQPGGSYELMCHPGWNDPAAAANPQLRDYHDWEGEMRTLQSPAFRALLAERQIKLISYKDIAS